MKKIFTLVLALMGFAGVANAATVDDLVPLKHSYVLVIDEYSNNGTTAVPKGLIGDDHFWLNADMPCSTGKGSTDLSTESEFVSADIVAKYGEYGSHLNSARLKNSQIVMAMKLTAKSKVIMYVQGNNKKGKEARIPKIATKADLSDALNAAPGDDHPATVAGFYWEYTVDNDGLYYIGSYNGDMFVSYVIIEATEAPGTPSVKVGPQTYENGLWYREVTCKANDMVEEGSTEKIPTVVTYTTDGSMPTAASTLYTEPIKCYKDMTVKFQAFMNLGDGKPADANICDAADNEGVVSFSFNAPTLATDGANISITSEYEGAKNFYTLNGGEAIEGNAATLTESATVEAYTQIVNGEYTTFTTKKAIKDVYVLDAIKEKKTIAVTAADVVIDEEATAQATDGATVYKVENGAISADKKDFFVKNLTFSVLKDAKAQYQVPEGQEAYIQMSNTNIVFKVAAGDKVKVKVTCSKNSCKNLDADDAAEDKLDNGCTPDRQCYVNVSGTNYCLTDAEGKHTNDLKLYPDANVFEFELAGGKTVKQNKKDAEGNDVLGEDGKAIQEEVFQAGDTYYTFQKYSGTGNILISSIEITPAAAAPAAEPWAAPETERAVNKTYDLAGTWAGDWFEPGQNYDASEYDYVWIKYSGYTGKINFGITYMEWESTQSWGEVYHSDAVTLNEAAGIAAVKLEKTKTIVNGINNVESEYKGDIYAKHVKNVFLQDQGTASKITVEGIYFGTEAAYNAAVATGIQGVKTVNAQNGAVFNLAGQRVDANYKGVVIVNGQKKIQK